MSSPDRSEWGRCKPWIEAALEYSLGTHTIEDVEAGIESGLFQFWSGKNCALVTEVVTYPRLKAMNYFLLGGDLDELVNEIEPALTAWAKSIGCDRVFGVGRKGFERAFRKSGFSPAWYVIVKDI